ncbi:MAG: PKD domain-containing protein [Chitinophagales bacterium]
MKFLPKIGWVVLLMAFWGRAAAVQSHSGAEESTLRFTSNDGQWNQNIRFEAALQAGRLFCTDSFLGFWMYDCKALNEAHHTQEGVVKSHYFRMRFVNANPHCEMKAEGAAADYKNFFLGNDPTKWRTGVKSYSTITYQSLWPGIDLILQGDGDGLKYSFAIHANGDAKNIAFGYEGIEEANVSNGELRYHTSLGSFRELSPYAFLKEGKTVRTSYDWNATESVLRFHFPEAAVTGKEWTIDPTIVFSSYTGSTADNWGYTATYDPQGNMYVGGYVNASSTGGGGSYPISTGAFQSTFGGGDNGFGNGDGAGIGYACDMGISKFNATGTQLLYSTYIGGSNNEWPNSLVVDAQGNLLIYGASHSGDFPTTVNAYDRIISGDADIVVTKLNSSGTNLLASTFIGGSDIDGENYDGKEFTSGKLKRNYGDQNRGEILVDQQGNVYVASCTFSSDFPRVGAFQNNFGGDQDGCVFKFNTSLSNLIYSSYAGGGSADACYSIALDASNGLYVCGGTMSSNFPTTSGVIHPTYQGGAYDGFLFHLNSSGGLQQSTFLGTGGNDQTYFVKLDYKGGVYVVGQTTGSYPVSSGVYSNPNSGQFVAQLETNLSAHVFSTVFGNGDGSPNISPTAFLVDTCGNIYVAGWGTNNSGTFPGFTMNMSGLPLTADALKSNTDGTDFYFIVLKKKAKSLLYGSYFGGGGYEHVDGGTSRFDPRGVIYEAICAGCGANSFTPTTPGVWSPTNQSQNCNLLGLKIAFNLAGTKLAVNANPRSTGCVPLTVQFTSTSTTSATMYWDFDDNSTSTLQNPIHTFTDTGTYHVMLIGIDPNSCNERDTAYIDVWVRDDSISANFAPALSVDCYTKKITLNSTDYPSSTYHWDFGDATQSAQHPPLTKTYVNSGTYNVHLTISDTSKCNLQADFTKPVYIAPIIKINLHPLDTVGCIPLSINFGNVTNNTTAAQYHWSFGDGDTSNLKNPTHVYLHGGTYVATVVLYDTLSCNRNDTAYFTVTAIDSFADADFITVNQFFFCDSVRVKVQSFYNTEIWETWNFGDGYTSTANPVTHTYIAPTFDTITHILYDPTKICKNYDTAQVIISLNPLSTSIDVPDTIGCVPFTATLYGLSPLLTTHYYWFFPDGDSSSGSPVQHTFSPTGTYQVYCISIDSNACVNRDSNSATIVVIDDSTRANFDIQILNACDSDLSVVLINTSTNATHYIWNYGNGNTSTDTNSSQHYHLPGSYTIQLWAEDTTRCHPRDSISKTVVLKPNSIIDFDIADICLGQTAAFINHSNPLAQYIWQFGDGDSSHHYSTQHTYLNFGDYTVQLSMTDTSTCNVFDTLEKKLTVYAQPIAAYTTAGDTFMFEKPIDFLNQSQFFNTSVWTFEDGHVTNETSPTYAFDHTIGWMTVCLEVYNDGAPCRDTICDSVFVYFKALIGVPNAFSPNGDGINDRVFVEGRGIVKLDFRIYNRWGQLVYEGSDQKEGWDGKFHGEPQEMEVYTYTVDAWLINKQYVPLKGNITLLR